MNKFDLTTGPKIADLKIIVTTFHELENLVTMAVKRAMTNHQAIYHQEKEKEEEKEIEKEVEKEKEIKGKEKVYKTRKQTCEILNITAPTLWKYTKSGKIPSLKIEGRVLYDLEQIYLSLEPKNFSPKK